MNFGTHLRNLRIQRKLSQQKIADDLDISQASVTSYENGVREPNFEMIKKLSDYFNVSPCALCPFSSDSNDEEAERIAEYMNNNPKMKFIFDRLTTFGERDINTVLAVVNSISIEQDG